MPSRTSRFDPTAFNLLDLLKPRPHAIVLICCILLFSFSARTAAQNPPRANTNNVTAQIRDEGMNHSQVMDTLSYLTEVIGPRLTGSPNHKRANEWTRDKLASWGLSNAHLEAWGPFGRGWRLKRFSAEVVEPQAIPLIAAPKAWSPGLDKPIEGDVVHIDSGSTTDFEAYKGKLKGAIVLNGAVREVKPRFEPLATRLGETNLLRLANAGPGRSFTYRSQRTEASPRGTIGAGPETTAGGREETRIAGRTNAPPFSSNVSRGGTAPRGRSDGRLLSFLIQEGAAAMITPSGMGDGGTLFVGSASLPFPEAQGTNRMSFTNSPRPWSTNAPATLPQITVATEDYNRLVRMLQRGEKLRMAIDLQVEFQDADLMAYNTIAEIPGTDLKDEVVMVGGHLDSWHVGTGATDDAVGVAVAMEAARIIKQLGLQPRRTVRVGLWAGEEQGLLGSRAYVAKHFGYWTNAPEQRSLRAPKDKSGKDASRPAGTNGLATRKLVRLAEYEKLSAYFNLDNGGGKIRGIYEQGNEAVGPLFRRWLEPFRDLDAETITLSNTGGTDHIPFDGIGLPAFQFIQDPLDYFSRTHHSNEDLLERVQPEDAKQAATILAAFAYNAAMLDERLPRKAAE